MSFTISALQRRLSKLPACASVQCWTHRYSTSPSKLTLPPHAEWRKLFTPIPPPLRDRVSLANPITADAVARSFIGEGSIASGSNKIIIEAFPGPGTLSRALLALDSSRVRKLIILEDSEQYLEFLRPLEAADPRVVVVPLSGYNWETYLHLEENGLFKDIETVPWENGVHPQLHFISHIPHTVLGEQLVAQFFRNIPDRSWLFKYGRVPMSFVLGEWIWDRATAPAGKTLARCKVSVISEATAQMAVTLPPNNLLPYDNHFHPRIRKTMEKRPESRRMGHPLVTANVVPHAEQIIESGQLDKWDYCLRRLFVRKGTPLKTAITTLGPGAETLLKMLTDPSLPPAEILDIQKSPRELNIAEWALVVRAFSSWPFAPDTLSVYEAFSTQNRIRG
ncbi:S-adenosyl-L-methionine-dependent methyltransferase [Trametopsis cervina]|nr:S-adenosyl-L-methionine-dependent methyltransferase [Trametopsis cervina]